MSWWRDGWVGWLDTDNKVNLSPASLRYAANRTVAWQKGRDDMRNNTKVSDRVYQYTEYKIRGQGEESYLSKEG